MTTLPQTAPIRQPRTLSSSQLAVPGHSGAGLAQTPPQSGMTAADVWRVIRSNLWLILIVVIVSAAIGFGLNSWLAAKYPRYTSTGLIEVHMKNELMSSMNLDHGAGVTASDLEVEKGTQVELLLHERLISQLLESSDAIRETEWFKQFVYYRNGQKQVDAEAAKADLLDRMTVRAKPDSRLIEVKVSWRDPKDCQTIVREIIDQRIKISKTDTNNKDLDASEAMHILEQNLEHDIRETNERMGAIAAELGRMGIAITPGATSKDFEFQQLISEQLKAQAFYGAAVAKLATFRQQLITNSAPELEEALQKNGLYLDYRRQMEFMEAEIADLKATFGDQNPKTLSALRRLETVKRNKDNTEADIKARTITLISANLENDADAAKQANDRIAERLNQVREDIATIAKRRTDYADLQRNLDNFHRQMDRLKDQHDKVNYLANSTKWSLIDWATQPDLPDHPTFPKWYIIIPVTVMVGLALSLGIAFLREMTDTTVRTPRDIARVGQMTLLGMIPHESDDPEAAGARLPLAIFEAPHSIIAEQFRHVRTRLQHAASLDTTRSILITGCSPEDGKTTVAVNLAAGLALNGRRILLVDANFRRPDLHNVFNCSNDVGFGDVLNDPDMFQDVVSDTEVPNLALITSGTRPSNPTELLESQLLIDFIERALEEYDHVIFDSGPLLMVSDSIALAPRVDGVVTVVRATGNSRGMLGRMRDELRRLKAEHLGVVLNAVRSHGGGYYGAMINSYYAYQNG